MTRVVSNDESEPQGNCLDIGLMNLEIRKLDFIRVERHAKLSKAFDVYAQRNGVDIRAMSFYCGRRRITSNHTPETLQLKDRAVILAVVEMTIVIKDQNGELTFDKITKTTKFFKLFSKHAQRKGVGATSLQFFLRGNPIRNNDTATTLKFTKKVTLIHCVMAK